MKGSEEFTFIGSDKLEKILDVRKGQRGQLRSHLKEGIYWFQVPGGRKIFWNWTLIRDYLINGPRLAHDQLVQEYLLTLPENSSFQSNEKA